jgi:hypothetical protein
MRAPAFIVLRTEVVSGEVFVYGFLDRGGEATIAPRWFALKDYAAEMAERDADSERRMRELTDKINRA